MALILSGRSEKEMANALGISPHTVHCHVKALYRAYGVCTRSELMAIFIAPAIVASFATVARAAMTPERQIECGRKRSEESRTRKPKWKGEEDEF